MTRESILAELPPFRNKRKLIKAKQTVSDIMQETLAAHEIFEKDYDKIAVRFLSYSQLSTLHKIFDFLKQNVRFEEETVQVQLTQSPAAILERGKCDCKCFALFVGGILDALSRAGDRFEWRYCYASYKQGQRIPSHVFVEAIVNGQSVWIDPVLSELDKRTPSPAHIRKFKRTNEMALYRLAGAPEEEDPVFSMLPRRHNHLASIPKIGIDTPISTNPVDWIKKNPVPAAVAAVVFYLLFIKKR